MHKVFGLLLGAVVHADKHSQLLDRLKSLSAEDEKQIVEELARIIGDRDLLRVDDSLAAPSDSQTVRHLLESLAEERDSYALRLLKMAEEMESDAASSTTISSTGVTDGDGRSNSPSTSKSERIQALEEENADLRQKLACKDGKLRFADEMALEYEQDLKEKAQKLQTQSEQLNRLHDQNAQLAEQLRQKSDDYAQLEFDCQLLQSAERDRKALLKEKEEWMAMRDGHEKLKKELDSLKSMLPKLKAEANASNELQSTNESLTLELRQLRSALKNERQEREEAVNRAQRLVEENEQLLHELKQTSRHSLSFADQSNASRADFSADASLEQQLNKSAISELEMKVHEMQLELAKAAQPEELQRLQRQHADLQERFSELADEKSALEKRLHERNAELKTASEHAKHAERLKVELKSRVVELSVAKAQIQQKEILEREKELLSTKLRNAESALSSQKEQLSKARTDHAKLEEQLQKQNARSRKDADETERVRDELHQLRADHESCARVRKLLEAERDSLRERADRLEDELVQSKMSAHDMEALRKRLGVAEQTFLERNEAVSELTADNETLRRQVELTSAKLQKLREELAAERTRLADLLSRLRSICTTCRSKATDPRFADDEALLKDDNLLIEAIDSFLLSAFTAARSEAEALSVQRKLQLQEISEFSRDIENLKHTRSQLDENGVHNKMKTQVEILQERLNASLARENELSAEIQAGKRTIEDLQRQLQQNLKAAGELSRLRIEQHDVESEVHALKERVVETTERLSAMGRERDDANSKLVLVQNANEALQSELDRMTKLNDCLAVDFDRCRFENSELKRRVDSMNERSRSASQQQAERRALEDALKQARDSLRAERDRLATAEQQLTQTRREYAALLRQKDTASEELAQLCETNDAQKSAITNLNLSLQQLKAALADKDAELANFRREIETLREYNSDENRLLVRQVEMLLRQNEDLHQRSDAYYVEQKELQEKLQSIRTHKETLEHRLAEQAENAQKLEKNTLVKRAARAFSLRSPGRKATNTRLPTREKMSGSEDSSIYSADEGCFLPSPPQIAHPQSLDTTPTKNEPRQQRVEDYRVTPVCSSSDRGSGSSPDYDQIHFGCQHLKKNSVDSQQSTAYASINSSFRSRNTRIGGSLRYPPNFRPTANNNNNINWRLQEDNGSERAIDVTPIRVSTPKNGGGLLRATAYRLPPPYVTKLPPGGNVRPPPPAYSSNSRLCQTPPAKPSPANFSPLDTSTPKSDHYIGQSNGSMSSTAVNTIPMKSNSRPVQLDPLERALKGQSFYDNASTEDLEASAKSAIAKRPAPNGKDLWVGFGCC